MRLCFGVVNALLGVTVAFWSYDCVLESRLFWKRTIAFRRDRNGMVKSWFTQISPSLQLIHKSVVNCELEPQSEERFKFV